MSRTVQLFAAVDALAQVTGVPADEWGHPTTPQGEDETCAMVEEGDKPGWVISREHGGFHLAMLRGWYEQQGEAGSAEGVAVLAVAMIRAYAALKGVLNANSPPAPAEGSKARMSAMTLDAQDAAVAGCVPAKPERYIVTDSSVHLVPHPETGERMWLSNAEQRPPHFPLDDDDTVTALCRAMARKMGDVGACCYWLGWDCNGWSLMAAPGVEVREFGLLGGTTDAAVALVAIVEQWAKEARQHPEPAGEPGPCCEADLHGGCDGHEVTNG